MKADSAQLAAALDAVERGKPLTPEQLAAWLNRPPPKAETACPVYVDDGCRFEPICVGSACRAVELGERRPE